MAKKTHQVTIRTTDGKEQTKDVSAREARDYDDLPFTSSNVLSTTIRRKS